MNFASLTVFLVIMQGENTMQLRTTDELCEMHLRTLSEQMPDADFSCVATSLRPIARPADFMRKATQ